MNRPTVSRRDIKMAGETEAHASFRCHPAASARTRQLDVAAVQGKSKVDHVRSVSAGEAQAQAPQAQLTRHVCVVQVQHVLHQGALLPTESESSSQFVSHTRANALETARLRKQIQSKVETDGVRGIIHHASLNDTGVSESQASFQSSGQVHTKVACFGALRCVSPHQCLFRFFSHRNRSPPMLRENVLASVAMPRHRSCMVPRS